MRVTEVKIRKLLHDGDKRAIVSIRLDDVIAVHDLKIIETDRLFIGFPSHRDENGKYRDIVHPTDSHTRTEIEKAVLQEYARVRNIKA